MKILFVIFTFFIMASASSSALADSLPAKDRYEAVKQKYKGYNALDKRQKAFSDYVAESRRNQSVANSAANVIPAAGNQADKKENSSDTHYKTGD
jgi:hypothetical protein